MRLVLVIWMCCSCLTLFGQDPFFSSQTNSGSFFSPSLTGNFDTDWKASLNYRTQWFSFDNSPGFNTLKASFEHKLPSILDDHWTVGLNIVSDEIFNSKYRQFLLQGSLSYKLTLGSTSGIRDRKNYLTLGTQLGIAQASFGWNQLWFGRQYDLNIYSIDLSADSGEPNSNLERSNTNLYPDVNLGIAGEFWLSKRIKIRTDLAGKHLNTPSQDFDQGSSSKIDPSVALMIRTTYLHTRFLTLEADLVSTLQGPFQQHLFRTGMKINNDVDGGFGFNIATRVNKTINGTRFDALIFGIDVNVERFDFGVYYDYYISEISQSNRSLSALNFTCLIRPVNIIDYILRLIL